MKKKWLVTFVLGSFVMMCFTGCKARTLSEKEIAKTIPENLTHLDIDGYTQSMEVDSIEIEKRKIDDGLDTVYCSVITENDSYRATTDCVLYYTLYDQGGWILDNWEAGNIRVTAIAELSQEETDMEMSRYYFDSYTYVSTEFEEDNQASFTVYDVSFDCDNYSYNGQVTLECWFDGYSWNKTLNYEKGIDWKVNGMWAASQEDISGVHFANSAFELNILNVDQEGEKVELSATDYYKSEVDTVQNIVADRMVVDYTGQDYLTTATYRVVPDEEKVEEMKYDAPTLSFIFDIEDTTYGIRIKPYEVLLNSGNAHGNLYKGYHIRSWVDEYGYTQFEKIYGEEQSGDSSNNQALNDSQQEPEESSDVMYSNDSSSSEYIIPGSDSRYLSESDLYGLSQEECRLARNELFARHGRKFKDAELQNYFNQFDWYYPLIEPDDFSESMLNSYEIANRDLLAEYEKKQAWN